MTDWSHLLADPEYDRDDQAHACEIARWQLIVAAANIERSLRRLGRLWDAA